MGTASGVIDYSAIHRAAKNTWKAVTGEKEMTFADWAELILLDAKDVYKRQEQTGTK